ncbi:MAG: hypothetical protein II180_00115, partial [Proteobacteria bacterium]|nr:hypothetical protein [Pseudomonadota bacterium]
MLKQIAILSLASLALCGCKSAPEPQKTIQAPVPVDVAPEDHEMFDASPEVVDLSSLGEKQVAAYTIGSEAMHLSDILPALSSNTGYDQKWEFFIYSKPYSARIKFEISNIAFSKNEGKIRGYIKEVDDDGNTVKEYKISE